MNKIWGLIVLAGLVSCNGAETTKQQEDALSKMNIDTLPKTSVLVLDTAINFGTVKEGEKVNSEFRFVNIGKVPLIVQFARASCGCTVAEKPKLPVMPGDTGMIKTTFNSEHRGGETVFKTIWVTSNADSTFKPLILRGKVEKSN
jgi:hypothetical protein